MATRKKAKGKTKAKRKKPPVTKATTRRKTDAAEKPGQSAKRQGRKRRFAALITQKSQADRRQADSSQADADPARAAGCAGGAYRRRDPLLQPPLRRGHPARARYVAGWRCNPYLRTHHRFPPEGRVLEVNHAPATEVGPNDDFGLKVVEPRARARRRFQSAVVAPLAGPKRWR